MPFAPLRVARLTAFTVAGMAILAASASAQEGVRAPVVNANWKLADRYTAEALRPFIYSSNVTPGWINRTDTFWYLWRDANGVTFWRVDPKAKKKEPLFDTDRMAEHLTKATSRPYDRTNLPITTVTFDENNADLVRFTLDNIRYEYDRKEDVLRNLGRAPRPPAGGAGPGAGGGGGGGGRFGGGGQGGPPGQQGGQGQDFRNFSPDRRSYVYAMDHNLYFVEVIDGKDSEPKQLTTDGVQYYSFGARAQGQGQQQQQQQQQEQQEQQEQDQEQQQQAQREQRVRPNVTWSRDSKFFYVTRNDSRNVKELFLVNSLSMPRPTLMTYKYAMPGEADVAQIELWTFNRDTKEITKAPVEKWKDQRLFDLHWPNASDRMRFVRRDRLQRNLELCEMALPSQEIKVLLSEKTENAFLETQNVRYVRPGGDFVWFSERTGWGHYYLYAHDGTLKNAITTGPWRASQIVDLDADKGLIWLRGNAREPEENPYYRHLYQVKLDGTNLTLLDPGNADHNSVLSPSKEFVVDVSSRTDMAPKAVLRNNKGQLVMELEEMDLSRLKEMGWTMPETFVVKAADGVTDIYGNMWKPTDFSPYKKYPIIAHVYPGPQTESVSSTFSATSNNQRLAQLGFIVIQIGNRGGNPARSNAYHSYGYYNLRDYGLADKKAGIEQLAARHSWIDVERVGIYGHSGGGFMTAAALLQPPYNDFFKVGVSSAGNHDNNVYNQNWSEQHHGLREVIKDGETTFEIKVPANHELAANLKGKLLLVHGDMDNNVHPVGTIRLVDALIKANKRFDLMIMPGKAHGFGDMQGYFNRMMMEYFCEHLLGDYYRGVADIRGN